MTLVDSTNAEALSLSYYFATFSFKRMLAAIMLPCKTVVANIICTFCRIFFRIFSGISIKITLNMRILASCCLFQIEKCNNKFLNKKHLVV